MDGTVIASREELIAGLHENRKELLEMCASKGWEVWLAWSKQTREGLQTVALRDVDPEVRERARLEMLTLEKFERLPAFIIELTQERVQTSGHPA